MQSTSLSSASRNFGLSQARFSASSSFVSVGKNCSASKNGASCSTMRWMLMLPIWIAAGMASSIVVGLLLLLDGLEHGYRLLPSPARAGARKTASCVTGESALMLGCRQNPAERPSFDLESP